jgi:hypothetical protein
MKKLETSVSPFLMLFVPVILFLGLALVLKSDSAEEEFVSGPNNKTTTNTLIKVGEQSFVRFLLKK